MRFVLVFRNTGVHLGRGPLNFGKCSISRTFIVKKLKKFTSASITGTIYANVKAAVIKQKHFP